MLWILSCPGLALAAGERGSLIKALESFRIRTNPSSNHYEWRRGTIQTGGGGGRRGRKERPDHPVHPGTDSTVLS